jgi:basic amino acid/polyamine antiporter, APA family
VHPRFGTPYRFTLITGAVVAVIASFVPLSTLAALVNIGTLFAFIVVALGVVVLRRTRPDLHRAFRVPLVPVVPALAVLMCLYLMLYLSGETWIRFVVWMLAGYVVYFTYSRRHSLLTTGRRGAAGMPAQQRDTDVGLGGAGIRPDDRP